MSHSPQLKESHLTPPRSAASGCEYLPGALLPRSAGFVLALLSIFALGVYWTTGGMTELVIDGIALFLFPAAVVWWMAHSSAGNALLTRALTPLDTEPTTRRASRFWVASGIGIMTLAVVILEWMQPLYFTQDDSLANGVVGMVAGAESFFAGQFPAWNPYQYFGAPFASMAYWSLTYPPTYLSYWLANNLLGNKWWTMEVYQIGHLMASFLALFVAARAVGLRPKSAAMAGVCVALAGTSLVVGRSWYATIPFNFWMALLVIGLCQLRKGDVTWRWVIGQGLAMGLLFHVGYPQTWVYAMMTFLGVGLLFYLFGQIPLERALKLISAQLVGVAIASPLLLLLLLETRGADVQPYGRGVGLAGLWAMLAPYPLSSANHPNTWGSADLHLMGQMYYFGSLLPLLGLIGVYSFAVTNHRKQTLRGNIWLLVAAFWLIASFGYRAALWPAMGMLPGFSNFSCPFKAQQMFNLFAAVGAGLMFDRLCRTTAWSERNQNIVVGCVFVLMLWHCSCARTSHYTYGFQPYPNRPAEFSRLEESGQRALAISPTRSVDPTFPHSLQLSAATAYRIPVVRGYDPLVEFGAQTDRMLERVQHDAESWQRYGVQWVVVHRSATDPMSSANETMKEQTLDVREYEAAMSRLQALGAEPAFETDAVTVYKISDVDPMAFSVDSAGGSKALEITQHFGGLDIDTSKLSGNDGTTVTVNFAARKAWSAEVDGVAVDVGSDAWDRTTVCVPPGTKQLALRYRPPWHLGCWVSVALLGMAGALQFAIPRFFRVVSAAAE